MQRMAAGLDDELGVIDNGAPVDDWERMERKYEEEDGERLSYSSFGQRLASDQDMMINESGEAFVLPRATSTASTHADRQPGTSEIHFSAALPNTEDNQPAPR
jgi:hypothetical protein